MSPTSTCVNERLRILNAYYLPIGGKRIVYDAITPVNTFRLLFNYYFGAHFAKLPDRSYYCTYDTPYRYENVTGSLH